MLSDVCEGVSTIAARKGVDFKLNSLRCKARGGSLLPPVETDEDSDSSTVARKGSTTKLTLDLNRIEAVTRLMSVLSRDPNFKEQDNSGSSAILCRCLRPIPDTVINCEVAFCCQICKNGGCHKGLGHDEECEAQHKDFEAEWHAINTGEKPPGVRVIGWKGWVRLDDYVAHKRLLDERSPILNAACPKGFFVFDPPVKSTK